MESENRASLACQVMTNLRCKQEIECAEIVKIIRKERVFDRNVHLRYFLGFFENCRPELIKKFMLEQGISRQQVMDIFEKVDNFGEVYKFRQAVANGKF